MFQLGLFTTHLPYILIIAFYAAAILFKPPHEEATFRDNTPPQEHSCLVSCKKYPSYLKEESHPTREKNNHWIWGTLPGIPGRQASSPPIIPAKLKFLTNYIDKVAFTFLSKNIPNRAPPASVLQHVG
jgi:hypothetical protein